MITTNKPTKDDFQTAIDECKCILKQNELSNGVIEGYKYCIKELKKCLKDDYKNDFYIPETEEELPPVDEIYNGQMKPIRKLDTVIGRAIAILLVDWLNGEDDKRLFLEWKKVEGGVEEKTNNK